MLANHNLRNINGQAVAAALALSVSITSCDSHLATDSDPLSSTRLHRDCPEPQVGPDEFAVRILNISDYRIDSVYVSLSTEHLRDPDIRAIRAATSDRRSQCYYVLPKTYRVGTAIRNYTFLFISAARFLPAHRGKFESFDARDASGKYSYAIDVEKVIKVWVVDWALFEKQASEDQKILVRVINESGSDLEDIRYFIVEGSIEIPFLAAGDSTEYFEIGPTFRRPGISLVVGADTVKQGSPNDFPGIPVIGPGRYVSRIDTVQYRTLLESGTYERDE